MSQNQLLVGEFIRKASNSTRTELVMILGCVLAFVAKTEIVLNHNNIFTKVATYIVQHLLVVLHYLAPGSSGLVGYCFANFNLNHAYVVTNYVALTFKDNVVISADKTLTSTETIPVDFSLKSAIYIG